MGINLLRNLKKRRVKLIFIFASFLIFSLFFINIISASNPIQDYSYVQNLSFEKEGDEKAWITFNNAGTRFFIGDWKNDKILQYNCSEAWNISSCYNVYNLSILSHLPKSTLLRGLYSSGDKFFYGEGLFDINDMSSEIQAYSCSTPWLLSTCAFSPSNDLDVQDGGYGGNIMRDLTFNNDGTNLITLQISTSGNNGYLYRYICSIPYDLSSCIYNSKQALGFDFVNGIFYDDDDNKIYVIRSKVGIGDFIYEFNISGNDINSIIYNDYLSVDDYCYASYDNFFNGNKLFLTCCSDIDEIQEFLYSPIPELISAIPNQNLVYNDEKTIFFNDYIKDYDGVNLTIMNITISAVKNGVSDEYEEEDLFIGLTPTLNNIYLTIKSEEIDLIRNIELFAYTEFGNITDEFIISVSEAEISQGEYKNFLTSSTDYVLNLFPDEENLNTKQKFGIVFIFMLIITLIVGYGLSSALDGINPLGLFILGALNLFALFFFVALGYINITIVILIFLLLGAGTFFSIRRKGN